MARKLYILSNDRGDTWSTDEFDNYYAAFQEGCYQWNHLTPKEREARIEFAIFEATEIETKLAPNVLFYEWRELVFDFQKTFGNEEVTV